MDRETLLNKLAYLDGDNPIGIELYFVIEEPNGEVIKFADIDKEVSEALLNQFNDYIHNRLIDNQELIFSNLTDADDRRNSAYFYDLDERPQGLESLNIISENNDQPKFRFGQDELNNIKAFVIVIGNQQEKVFIYKKHYPINLLKRDSILRIFPARTRFEKLDTNVLNINENFEFMQIDGDLIVLSVKVLEKNFGFEQIIRRKALENLELISGSGLLSNIDELTELSGELKYAKKLMRIKASTPVLNLDPPRVINFIRNHPLLTKKIRFTDDNSHIALDTRVSKELFLKLLNDDFLKSELTDLLYDSQTKETMVITQEE